MTPGIRDSRLKSAALVGAIVIGLTAAARAQQPAPVGPPSQEEQLKNNVQLFEMALKNSIINAGSKVADWAQKIDPTVLLNFVAQPEVRAVPLMDNSLVFHVDVAEIGVSSALWYQNALQRGLVVPPSGGASRVGATPVPADPLNVKAAVPVGMTPSQYLTEQVREGLINTILDSSTMLPMRAGQTLTVACNPVDVLVTNPLYRNTSKKLVLTIKGEDLLALRQGTLTREDAKQRIVERRF